ncbi:MAG: hypothetical protein V2J12_07995 [Gammaproteobacteria bacterium]|jgi:hypothetical protein|nr:hypothetical protein [Gammaproteobacteria bacterium]
MKPGFVQLAVVALIAMLALQISGAHLHSADPDGGAHAMHVHDVHNDHHDHADDSGVSLLQLILLWSKLVAALPAAVAGILITLWVWFAAVAEPPRPPLAAGPLRWRPPLRAPPASG